LGKLGIPLAACLASKEFSVIGVDTDTKKVDSLNRGQSPIFEPGLKELIDASRGHLTATRDTRAAVLGSDITCIIVPTPSNKNHEFSLKYILAACETIGEALREKQSFHLVVLTSTVMPGDTQGPVLSALERSSGKRCGQAFGLCYSPEFIALGSVIRDFLNPDFLLIGESDSRSGEMLEDLYRQVCDNNPPVSRMNFINAEIAKLAVNTFVTTKITFANMLARICELLPEAQVDVVTGALGLDSRIGSKYLKGSISYGGPCFPRDNLALQALGSKIGAPMLLAQATDQANRQAVQWLAGLVAARIPATGAAGILGMAYKPNTDVVEESFGLLLAQELISQGITTMVYDPAAGENAIKSLGEQAGYCASAAECIQRSDVVVIATPWEEFKHIDLDSPIQNGRPRAVIDCWRMLDPKSLRNTFEYLPLGNSFLNSE
jgi:UDPglucose 6-dehydrogenase